MQKYQARSDCTEVQASLALHWWQNLITFGLGRIRIKGEFDLIKTVQFKSCELEKPRSLSI